MRLLKMVVLFAFLTTGIDGDEKFKLGLLNLSAGSWVTYDGLGNGIDRLEFHKAPSVAAYFSLFGLPAHLALPMQYNVSRRSRGPSPSRWGFADLQGYVGLYPGAVEPRIGFQVPMFYDWEQVTPWMGTGNTRLMIGLGANSERAQLTDGYRLSADVEFSFDVDGKQASPGSWHNMSIFKYSTSPVDGWNLGLETMVLWSRWKWSSWADEWKLTVMPGALVEYYPDSKTGFGLKVGHSILQGQGPIEGGKLKSGTFDGKSFNIAFIFSLYG